MPVPDVLLTAAPQATAAATASPAATAPPAAARPALTGIATGTGAMVCVGGSVAVSGVLAHAPVFTAEALRYAMACIILLVLARLSGRRLVLPRGAEWLWLAGIAATGLVLFNVALVAGSRHAATAASTMGSGVGKSGSPAPKPITWAPAACRALALASTARVADSEIAATRAETLVGMGSIVAPGARCPAAIYWTGRAAARVASQFDAGAYWTYTA